LTEISICDIIGGIMSRGCSGKISSLTTEKIKKININELKKKKGKLWELAL
jgi:hypothetical protein